MYAADIFLNFTSSLTQIMICYIFWKMDSIQFVPVPATEDNDNEEAAKEEVMQEVRVERTDSEFDLQLRMWQ